MCRLMKMVQEPAKTFLAQQWTYPEASTLFFGDSVWLTCMRRLVVSPEDFLQWHLLAAGITWSLLSLVVLMGCSLCGKHQPTMQPPNQCFLKQILGYHDQDDEDLEVSVLPDQLWANINRPGDWNARHTHGSNKLSSQKIDTKKYAKII